MAKKSPVNDRAVLSERSDRRRLGGYADELVDDAGLLNEVLLTATFFGFEGAGFVEIELLLLLLSHPERELSSP